MNMTGKQTPTMIEFNIFIWYSFIPRFQLFSFGIRSFLLFISCKLLTFTQICRPGWSYERIKIQGNAYIESLQCFVLLSFYLFISWKLLNVNSNSSFSPPSSNLGQIAIMHLYMEGRWAIFQLRNSNVGITCDILTFGAKQ